MYSTVDQHAIGASFEHVYHFVFVFISVVVPQVFFIEPFLCPVQVRWIVRP